MYTPVCYLISSRPLSNKRHRGRVYASPGQKENKVANCCDLLIEFSGELLFACGSSRPISLTLVKFRRFAQPTLITEIRKLQRARKVLCPDRRDYGLQVV